MELQPLTLTIYLAAFFFVGLLAGACACFYIMQAPIRSAKNHLGRAIIDIEVAGDLAADKVDAAASQVANRVGLMVLELERAQLKISMESQEWVQSWMTGQRNKLEELDEAFAACYKQATMDIAEQLKKMEAEE